MSDNGDGKQHIFMQYRLIESFPYKTETGKLRQTRNKMAKRAEFAKDAGRGFVLSLELI